MLSTWLLGTSGILSYETGFIACGMRMILLLDTSRVLRVRVEKKGTDDIFADPA